MARKKKTASKSSRTRYTRPSLRERIKERIKNSGKAGKPGQWSARKAQLLATEYKEEGGGYKGGQSKSQKQLGEWDDAPTPKRSKAKKATKKKTAPAKRKKKVTAKATPKKKATKKATRKATKKASPRTKKKTTRKKATKAKSHKKP